MQARVRFVRSAQPSAEIARVECAKCRRECDLPAARATLCGDRARRVREMQARVRFAGCARNPVRRSCVSSARNAGESAICRLRAQPSAEIVRVECAQCICPVARVRFAGCLRNPLRRSCVSSVRNAGERAIWRLPASSSPATLRTRVAYQITLSSAFRALDRHDLRRGLRGELATW